MLKLLNHLDPATDDGDLPAAPDELAGLARAAAAGDADAASTLVMHLGGSMFAIVRRVLGRRHADIDDAAQDAVIALLGALPNFRNECGVAHFAHRIALLTALATLRRARVRLRFTDGSGDRELDAEAEAEADDVASPWATTVSTRRRVLVRQLLDELPDVIAEALALHFILGYTVDEIAEAAAISPNTVWSRLRLGKQALRRKLEGDARLAELLEVGA